MSEQNENKITAIFLSEKENKIKWHHSRWFWGIVVGTLLIWSLFFYFFTLNIRGDIYWKFVDISYAFGATPFLLYGDRLLDKLGVVMFGLIYYFIFFLLLYKIFYKPRVKIIYPSIFVSLFILGTIVSIFILSGF